MCRYGRVPRGVTAFDARPTDALVAPTSSQCSGTTSSAAPAPSMFHSTWLKRWSLSQRMAIAIFPLALPERAWS